jgi:serine/threonine protein kinase
MLTKKKTTPMRKNTTRKIPSFEKLPKTNRSRIFSMETYKINCDKNKLYGYKSYKGAEETSMHKDDFVHVVLSKLQDYDKPVVVKVYDANKLQLLLEKKILEKIRDYRNTARLICDFSCNDDKNNYITKITKQIKFCERGTNKLHFFVYEYIANGDISDYLKKTRDLQIIKTLILQTVCVIIELATIYKVCHGDLNSGNILINTTDEKTLEYKIGDEIVVIESNGIIPIIIDFGRSKFYREPINNHDIWYDIIMVISLINRYVKNYDINLVSIENEDPFELDLPSIKDYYFYVRNALYSGITEAKNASPTFG